MRRRISIPLRILWRRFRVLSLARRISVVLAGMVLAGALALAITRWVLSGSYYIRGTPLVVMRWDATGNRLALAYEDGSVDLLTFKGNAEGYASRRLHPTDANWLPADMMWSPDGRKLAVSAHVGPLYVYEFDDKGEVRPVPTNILSEPDEIITHMNWSPDGSIFSALKGSETCKLLLLDGITYKELPQGAASVPANIFTSGYDWSRSGRLALIRGHKELAIWDPRYPSEIKVVALSRETRTVEWSPDEMLVILDSSNEHLFYDIASNRVVFGENIPELDSSSAWRPTGENATVLKLEDKAAGRDQGRFVLQTFVAKAAAAPATRTMVLEPPISDPPGPASDAFAWSKDGRLVASNCFSFTLSETDPVLDNVSNLIWWDAANGRIVGRKEYILKVPDIKLPFSTIVLLSGYSSPVRWTPTLDKASIVTDVHLWEPNNGDPPARLSIVRIVHAPASVYTQGK